MNTKFQHLVVLFCLVLFSVTFTSCKQVPQQPHEKLYPVLKVEAKDHTFIKTYPASIEGKQDISILPQISGKITKLYVTEGEHVKAGQALFMIDQVPYQAALLTAQAQVKVAEAQVATAQLNYKSTQELYKEKVVSDYTLQTSKNALLTAQAQRSQAQANETNAANNLSYTLITSPSDGVVGSLPYRVGTLVAPSMTTPLTKVTNIADMYVYFSMNESEVLTLIRQYGSLEQTLQNLEEVQLQLSDQSLYEEKGHIASISGVINPATGTLKLRAEFPNPNSLLHSGASGAILLPTTLHDIIYIPQAATYEIQDKVFVYQIVEGKARGKMITVFPSNDGTHYAVTAGLTPGEEIISEGVGLLHEGTPVTAKK